MRLMNPPKEYRIVPLREYPCATQVLDTPEKAADYYTKTIRTEERYNPEVECFHILILTSRRTIKGHVFISMGTMDTILVHPREVFRPAIIAAAAAIILVHNHPSGDPTPSEADIKVTRDLYKAGQMLKLEVLDHIIMGQVTPERERGYVSLRELGYFTL